jgi:hypothetical protein
MAQVLGQVHENLAVKDLLSRLLLYELHYKVIRNFWHEFRVIHSAVVFLAALNIVESRFILEITWITP